MKKLDYITIEWHIEDVKSRAKEHGIKLTDEQARDVLSYAKRNHDANIGINWEVLDIWIDEVINAI